MVRSTARRIAAWPSAASSGTPGRRSLPIGYNSNYQIVQNADYVMILTEMIHDVRIVPLDGRPPLPQGIRQLMGSSRGRWEGEHVGCRDDEFHRPDGFQGSGENMRVTERFTRVSTDTLKYEFTVEGSRDMGSSLVGGDSDGGDHGPIFEYACHEGNYGLANNLAGARAEEKAAARSARRGTKGSQ